MDAFLLETLLSKGWRKGGEVFWTVEDATTAGRTLVKRKIARGVRVLPVSVGLQPVAEIPEPATPPLHRFVAHWRGNNKSVMPLEEGKT
jgi:hypothetical protein